MRGQIQLKLSITEEIQKALKERAQRLGMPSTKYAIHILVNELEGKTDHMSPEATIDDIELDEFITATQRIKMKRSLRKLIKKRWGR